MKVIKFNSINNSKTLLVGFKLVLLICLLAGQTQAYTHQKFSTPGNVIKTEAATLNVNRLFADNMVLQQGIPVAVWGTAAAGEKIALSLNNKVVRTVTGTDQKWLVKFPAMAYGGPYTLAIKGANETIRIKNVMVGEVWIASGQSNMNFKIGWPVANIKSVLADADYPMIREFTVPLTVSKTPLNELTGGAWEVCNVKNVVDFSAVTFFFARELYLNKKVAIGIIHTSYGGTPIETWLSAELSKPAPDNDDWSKLQAVSDSIVRVREQQISTTAEGVKAGVQLPDYNDQDWKQAAYPIETFKRALSYSFVWFRRVIDLPASIASTDLVLRLGKIKESDVTYFNGVEVGRSKLQDSTIYTIPGKLIKPGRNVIAIKLLSQWGNGRLGYPEDVPILESKDKKISITLTGQWAYNATIEPKLVTSKGYQNKPSALFNGMINPLIPYGIKGFLWYQGEANARNYKQYQTQQPALLQDWRKRWGLGDIPFLFVQLPNYKIIESWPWMREAQANALNYPNTGMAVTIDVGNRYDGHPLNKEPVGHRLALLAFKMAYHENVISTGPVYDTCKIKGHTVSLRFKEEGGILKSDSVNLGGFTIAAADHKFYPANAYIKNNEVVVSAAEVSDPVAVRYAWEPDPQVSLYNTAGLPAAPFRTDGW